MVKFKKLIVSLLLVTFISSSIPLQVFAEEQGPTECNPQEIYTGDTDIKTNEKESTKLILEENIEKREENVKHFLLDDKTYEAVVYNESVHYREGEQWKDIDNTLEETIDEEVLSEEALSPEEELKIQGEELSNSITDEINGEEVINKEDSSNGKESINEEETANESTEEAVNESENVDETEKVDESSEVKEGENKVNQNQSEIEKSKGNTNNVFQNIANSFKLKIAKKADAKKLIRISRDNYEISWGIEGVSKVFSEVINTDENKVNELIEKNAEAQVNQNIDLKSKSIDVKNEEKQRIIENEKKKTLNKISSSVTYKEIFKDIDLNYKIVGDVVKENIIINKYTEKNEFVFNLKVKNLIAEKQQDNSIIFYDENDLTKKQFIIAAPFMIDSNNVTSSDVEVKIEEQNKGYKLTYIINKEWLKDSTRKYPVTLDPVVETSLSPTNIYDTFISKGNPNQNNVLAHILSVGYGQYSQETRSLISFNLPTLTAAESVIGAKFSLYLCDTDSYAGQIDIHKVNSSWNSNTVTWNNQPQFNSNIEDYQIMGNYGPYTWDITGIVKDWYVTGENNGLLVKHRHENPGYANINDYLSSDTSADFEAGRPQVTIFYINNSGIEGYWNYHSQAVGRAGVSYTNDFNGNVVHVHDDITMTGSRNPISIKHVYNSNNLGWDPSKPWFGRGWNLSIYQWLVKKQIGGVWYFEYTDGDGTKHYFKDTGDLELKDELNIGYTLTKDAGGYFKYIKDKDDNQIKFYGDDAGSLYSFIDNQGNETITTWEKAANGVWCITALTDTTGRKVTLHYDKNAYLTDIVDPSGQKMEFVYDPTFNKMINIKYPDGQVSKFGYYPNSYLYGVTNVDDYSIWYEYTPYEPYRVKKMYEWYNGAYGNEITMSYGNNTTKFTDLKNRSEFYQFDKAGKTVSIKNADDSAQYFRYGSAENRTKIGQSSKLQKTIMNLLENHDAELNAGWLAHNSLATYTQEDKVLGSKSFKISSSTYQNGTYFEQYVKLTKGKTYTFSGQIKTVGVTQGENVGAALTIAYLDVNGAWKYERVCVNGTKDWERYEKSFTLPTDSTNDRVWIAVELLKASGTAYFDCLQLEEGEVANRYNLVENPDFTLWDSTSWKPLYWTSNGNCDMYDYVDYADSTQPSVMNTLAMKFAGNARADKGIYQDIDIKGSKGDVYVLGGWAKANSAYLSTGRLFQLDVGFMKGGAITWKTVPFNPDTDEWQYAASAVVADDSYDKIRVYISYYENVNFGYFDGIQLYKEEFGTSFQYDSKGNVVSTANLAKQNSQFQYNDKNDLISSIDPRGNKFAYEYDGKHNVTKATTSENVVYSFSYDKYGNPLTAKVSDASGALIIQSEATYDSSNNYIKTVKDSSGNTVSYSFNQTKGTLENVTDSKGKTTAYTYEPYTNAISTVSKNVDNVNVTNTYEYDRDKLTNISHNNFKYNFVYDGFGNNTNVNIKSADGAVVQNLITNKYEDKTHMLQYSQYGNGNKIVFGYDSLDRMVSKKNNTEERFRYKYDGNSNLAIKEDLINRKNYRYFYDLSDRMMKIEEVNTATSSKIAESKYRYDLNNNLVGLQEKLNGKGYVIGYSYDKDNKPTRIITNNTAYIDYKYDSIGRRVEQNISADGDTYTTKYTFKQGINGSTTEKIESITTDETKLVYTYDSNGNIETINHNGKEIKYYYNELNELKREDNEVLNKTITYTYDIGGNLQRKSVYPYNKANPITLAATSTINYGYTDGTWKDKLTSYNGKAITYDTIGNPLTYDGTTYTWEMGRQLKSINKGTLAVSYKYDDGGIRTEKTVNGVTTSYHLLGDKVTYEETGVDKIYYTYDAAGNLATMILNGVEYYYQRNGQNDIIGLTEKTGLQVVSYTYDSWGKLISIDGSLKSTVGAKNPYRYRGYRYDTETGLYYLNSRYYNPEWGRFINADMIVANTGDILGSNMYAYCKNNPVNMEDQDGDIPTMVVGALIGIGVQLASDAITGEFSGWGSLASAAFTGALSNGTSAMAAAVRIIGGATIKNVVDTVVYGGNRRENWDWKEFGQDIIANSIGEGVAAISCGIISKYQYKKNYSQTANSLRKSGKYDGYNKNIVYKKMKSTTNIMRNLGTLQNWTVSVGYNVVSPY